MPKFSDKCRHTLSPLYQKPMFCEYCGNYRETCQGEHLSLDGYELGDDDNICYCAYCRGYQGHDAQGKPIKMHNSFCQSPAELERKKWEHVNYLTKKDQMPQKMTKPKSVNQSPTSEGRGNLKFPPASDPVPAEEVVAM